MQKKINDLLNTHFDCENMEKKLFNWQNIVITNGSIIKNSNNQTRTSTKLKEPHAQKEKPSQKQKYLKLKSFIYNYHQHRRAPEKAQMGKKVKKDGQYG